MIRAFCMAAALGLLSGACSGANIQDVVEHGAASDGKTLATEAIQRAIDACAAEGGGVVRFPPGRYLSGTLVLRSGVTLSLDEGATLLGSTDLKDYPHKTPAFRSLMTEYKNVTQSLIYAERAKNIAIRGKGCIDGQGAAFPRVSGAEGLLKRPFIIRMIECRNVLVEGVSLRNSASWMQSYLACDDLTIRGISVRNFCNFNNDCIDIDGCERVRIADVDGASDDDGLCFKGTSLRPTRNVVVERCRFRSHCNSLKFGTDSQGGLTNVVIRDVELGRPDADAKFFLGRREGIAGMAWEVVDGGVMENVSIDNVKILGTCAPVFLRLGDRGRHLKGNPRLPPGKMRNIAICNVRATEAGPMGCPIVGLAGHPIENLTLRNIEMTFAGGGRAEDAVRGFGPKPDEYPEAFMFAPRLPAFGLYCWHVRGLNIENVRLKTLKPDERPSIVLENAEEVVIDGRRVEPGNVPPGVKVVAAP